MAADQRGSEQWVMSHSSQIKQPSPWCNAEFGPFCFLQQLEGAKQFFSRGKELGRREAETAPARGQKQTRKEQKRRGGHLVFCFLLCSCVRALTAVPHLKRACYRRVREHQMHSSCWRTQEHTDNFQQTHGLEPSKHTEIRFQFRVKKNRRFST